ncbi:MAG: hypothetical protein AAGI30_07900 [Planctomycetota bacterium]
MRADPIPLERPLVVFGGWNAAGWAIGADAARLKRHVSTPELVLSTDYFWQQSFEGSRDHAIGVIESRFPSGDPSATVEVDVVGVSMGGVVARFAALPRDDGGKRLRIRRLFTLASPHRGARLADAPLFWDKRVAAMRPGSPELSAIDAAWAEGVEYELVCYTLLSDEMVGEWNTAPVGHPVYWLANRPFQTVTLFYLRGSTDRVGRGEACPRRAGVVS